MKKRLMVLLVILLLAAAVSLAENGEIPLPSAPAEPTDGCVSQEEAVRIARQKMADDCQRPISDFDFHKVKACFVKLENGQNAWNIMIDHPNEKLDVGMAVILSPKDGAILACMTNEENELNLVLLEQWKKQKGDLRTWSAEDKALFDWLYGSAETCADVSEYPVSMEKATRIALSALPMSLPNPEISCTFKRFSETTKGPAQAVWLVAIGEDGQEAYVVYVSAVDGAVMEIIKESNLG